MDTILSGTTLNDDQIKSLEVLDRLLTGKLKTIEELDQSVLSLCSVDVIQAEIEDAEKVLERVVECQKRIQDALQTKSNGHEGHQLQFSSTSGATSNLAKAKLPKSWFCRNSAGTSQSGPVSGTRLNRPSTKIKQFHW